ncbi:hypothetical protein QYM36_002439, partial [Artemia franciscana]
ASPGNLSQFENLLFGEVESSQESPSIAALQVSHLENQKLIGFGLCDVNSRKFLVSEFADNDSFTNVEALLAQLGPREVLIPGGSDSSQDTTRLKQVIERSGAMVTEKKKADFSSKDIVQDLNRLLKLKKKQKGTAGALPEVSLNSACSCLASAIKYADILMDESNFNSFKISTFDFSRYMRLDSNAIKALNVLPTPGQPTLHSLVGLLDKCKTPQGSRLLTQWVRQPLTDLLQLEARLDLVQAFIDCQRVSSILSEDMLKRIPDFQKLAVKMLKKKGTLQDCYRIYLALEKLPSIISLFEEDSELLKRSLGTRLSDGVTETEKLKELVESTVDLNRASEGDFIIRPDFDEELEELHNSISEIEDGMQKALQKTARDLALEAGKTIKLEDAPQHGYCYRVTMKEEKGLRNNRNYTTLDVTKGGVRFRNSDLTDLNSQFKEKKKDYEENQKRIVDEIVTITAGYFEPLMLLNDVIAEIDTLLSLATVALNAAIPWVRPSLLPIGTGILKIAEARHPCLEATGVCDVIPNDASFSQDDGMFHIITGPNMGGKSTYLRTVGLCVLLAQIGSFVPCESAEISLHDAIYTRVGAGDIMLRGVSTFLAEMIEVSVILQAATSDSLILVDELGRGTSTYDGFGLASAISKKLATGIKSHCLFATHYHELTRLAQSIKAIKNYHVTALSDGDSLIMLYKVKPGVCDQSFGIHVAEIAKFPERILEAAKEKVTEYETLSGSSKGDEINKIYEYLNGRVKEEDGDKALSVAARELKRLLTNL